MSAKSPDYPRAIKEMNALLIQEMRDSWDARKEQLVALGNLADAYESGFRDAIRKHQAQPVDGGDVGADGVSDAQIMQLLSEVLKDCANTYPYEYQMRSDAFFLRLAQAALYFMKRRQPKTISPTPPVSPEPGDDVVAQAIALLSVMRPGVRRELWEDFLHSRGAWGKGGNNFYMHVSPDEVLRLAAAMPTQGDAVVIVALAMLNAGRVEGGHPTVASFDGFDDETKSYWLSNAKAALAAMPAQEVKDQQAVDLTTLIGEVRRRFSALRLEVESSIVDDIENAFNDLLVPIIQPPKRESDESAKAQGVIDKPRSVDYLVETVLLALFETWGGSHPKWREDQRGKVRKIFEAQGVMDGHSYCLKCGGLKDAPDFHQALCMCMGELTVCTSPTTGQKGAQ